MLHQVVFQVIANQVRVPTVVVQQALHTVGCGVASLLRQLPTVLALHCTEQTTQVVQNPAARLRSPESSRDASMHLVDALGPPGDFRHLIFHNNHHLTTR